MTYIHKAFLLFLITINFGISAHASPTLQNQAKCLEKSAFLQNSFNTAGIFRDINSTDTDKIKQTIKEQSENIKALIANAIIKDCPGEIARIIQHDTLKMTLPITFDDKKTIYVTLPPVKSSDLESMLDDVLAAIWISHSPNYYIGDQISETTVNNSPVLRNLPQPTDDCLQNILSGEEHMHAYVGTDYAYKKAEPIPSYELNKKYGRFDHFKGKYNFPSFKDTKTGSEYTYDTLNRYQVLPANDKTSYFPYLLGAKHTRGTGKQSLYERYIYGKKPSVFYYPIFFTSGFRPILDFIKDLKEDIKSQCEQDLTAWNAVNFYIVGISNNDKKGIKKEDLNKSYDTKAKDSIRILYGPITF